MNLSASISSKNKYRTNSQNNTAARTFAGHFEGLHGTMQPGTKLPNLDQRHQPKDASEIVLQNKLNTPAPSSAKFGQSKYASPIRSSAQNAADQFDPRYQTEQRVNVPPPFTRTSHTEKKRYNPPTQNTVTPASLVELTRQEEASSSGAFLSPSSKFRQQAVTNQQSRQWNNQTEPHPS